MIDKFQFVNLFKPILLQKKKDKKRILLFKLQLLEKNILIRIIDRFLSMKKKKRKIIYERLLEEAEWYFEEIWSMQVIVFSIRKSKRDVPAWGTAV